MKTTPIQNLTEERSFSDELVAPPTEVRAATESQRQREDFMQCVLRSLPAHIAVLDREGVIVAVNEAWTSFGRANGNLRLRGADVGANYLEVCRRAQGEDKELAHVAGRGIEAVLGGYRYFFSLEYPCHSPIQQRWFLLNVAPLKGLGGAVISHTDITSRHLAEEDIRLAHAETEGLLAAITSILIGLDKQGKITRWNDTAVRTFGVSAEDALGKVLPDVLVGWKGAEILSQLAEKRSLAVPSRLEDLHLRDPQGNHRLLAFSVHPVARTSGRSNRLLLLGSDLTQRKRMEEELQRAQKLESIGQLAAGIAHEINTPIQFVGDNTHFLRESFQGISQVLHSFAALLEGARTGSVGPELVRETEQAMEAADLEYLIKEIPQALEQSQEGLQRVARIVWAMKEFSHPGGDDKVAIHLNRAIETTVTVARNEWKYVAEMVLDLDPALPPVPCFQGEFNQALLNLIVNAAHAISDKVGGKHCRHKGTITVRTRRIGEWVEVQVEDTGTGIPEEIRPRIFDPFFTTKPTGQGTGQGLALVHSVIVTKHGGTIHFTSVVDQGTTFVISLPIRPERGTAVPPPTRREQ